MSILDLIGTQITEQSVDTAIRQAGLDWQVTKERLKHPVTGEDGQGSAYATMRSDNLLILKWGVSNGYHIVQNRFAFILVDNLVQTLGCRIVRAGEFRGGRRVYMHVETPEQIEVSTGINVRLKLLFQNAHDTSMSQRCNLIIEDTMTGAILPPVRRSMMRAFSWRHTAAIEARMAEAAGMFTRTVANFQLCGDVYTRLAHQRLDPETADRVLLRVYPRPEEPGEVDSNQIHRAGINELFQGSSDRTAYSMLSALSNYVDNVQDRKRISAVSRAKSVAIGPGLKTKFLALEELEALSNRNAVEHSITG